MKIIFSTSKNMDLNYPINEDWNISKYTSEILKEIKILSDEDIKNKLKINDKIFEKVKTYILNFDKKITYEAIKLYTGLSYKSLNIDDFDVNDFDYLNKHLIILSAFYGPISPSSLIKPYRLDFTSKIKINNQSLSLFWKNKFDECFSKGETILNLASDEFSSLLNKEKYNWVNFEFYEEKNGLLKKHSTISKKGRGEFLRYLAKNKITKLDDIKLFANNDIYISENSNDNNFIFVKKLS